jgi:hypothetical protein
MPDDVPTLTFNVNNPVDIPEDCGGPHHWERASLSMCGDGCCDSEKILECADCLKAWTDDRSPEWQAVWNLSDWP